MLITLHVLSYLVLRLIRVPLQLSRRYQTYFGVCWGVHKSWPAGQIWPIVYFFLYSINQE